MKKLNKYIMLFAAFAIALASCTKEDVTPVETETSNVLKVRFGTDAPITKAVSTTDDTNFSSSWIADKDKIGVTSYSNATPFESNVYAMWDGDAFEAGFKNSYDPTTTYQFKGVYPYSETGAVEFGNTRDQIYNAQNGKYDIMASSVISSTLPATKTLILPMDRQTATVYFHLKSEFNEEVKSVTLVTDDNKPIAAISATLDTEYGFVPNTGDNCNFITLNIQHDDSNVMHTTDMQFWFNVLPVEGTSLKLIVESENCTFTMNKKSNTTTWEAGHLYTTVLEGIPSEKWVEKAGEPEPVEVDYSLSSTGWANQSQHTTLELDENLTVTASGGTNTGKFYISDNTWRFYAGENATATFSLVQGYTFKTAKITYSTKDYGTLIFNNNPVESETDLQVDGQNSFVVSAGSTSGSSGKVLISKIYVEYVAGSEPFDPLNPSYAITVKSGIQNGTVKAINADSETITYAKAGDIVTLFAIPETGYTIVANSLKATNSVTETPIAFTEGTTFTMPAANIIVEAAFEKAEYTVTGITGTDENHGSVSVNKGTAYYGDEIELTVTPDEGYRLKEGSLKINGSITPTQKMDGETPVENVFVFNMPAEDATVSATFEVIKYELSDQSGSHGSIKFYYPLDLTTEISEAASGESVKVVAVPVDATYQLKSGTLSVYQKGDKSTVYDLENDVFTMPVNAVSATATFEDIVFTFTNDPSSNLIYGIYDSDGQEISSKGSIASRSGAANTKTIKLVATNVPSGKTAQWTVTGNAGLIATSPVEGNPNAVTFTMPASNVTIKCIEGESKNITLDPANDITFPKDGITISVTGGTLTNGTDYRVYKNQTMTITSTVGNITNIALTYDSKSYDGGGWAAAYQPNAASWTSPVADGEQARITKIVVTVTGSSSGGDTPTLNSIAVKTAPTKVAYTEGDKFEPAGLVITKTMSDNTTEDVTYSDSNKNDFSFDPSLTTALATTDTEVTITYGGKSCKQSISVTTGGQGGGTEGQELPFSFNDNGSNLLKLDYVTGDVDDYATSNAKVAFKAAGKYFIIQFSTAFTSYSFNTVQNGATAGSVIRVFGSADGTNYTKIQDHTISQGQNKAQTISKSQITGGYKYIKVELTTMKSNVGLGQISIQ